MLSYCQEKLQIKSKVKESIVLDFQYVVSDTFSNWVNKMHFTRVLQYKYHCLLAILYKPNSTYECIGSVFG